jgi:hypothetical protein
LLSLNGIRSKEQTNMLTWDVCESGEFERAGNATGATNEQIRTENMSKMKQ